MTRRATAVTLLRKAGRYEEADQVEREGKRGNKYGAVRTDYNGRTYDSRMEAEFAAVLDKQIAAGIYVGALPQVPFWLPGGTKYVCDFLVLTPAGRLLAYDVKGKETETFRVKWREVKVTHRWVSFLRVRQLHQVWSESDD